MLSHIKIDVIIIPPMEHKSYNSAMRASLCTRDSDMSVINNDARIIYVLHFLIQFNL